MIKKLFLISNLRGNYFGLYINLDKILYFLKLSNVLVCFCVCHVLKKERMIDYNKNKLELIKY
jgi:hypothetical protein